ncbi:MAG TPA: putative Ig domain-containing protein, partial [Leptospiraceae bacterium]|nr:putative Ig domain-containing protein [Leptospiraceae bacterium]
MIYKLLILSLCFGCLDAKRVVFDVSSPSGLIVNAAIAALTKITFPVVTPSPSLPLPTLNYSSNSYSFIRYDTISITPTTTGTITSCTIIPTIPAGLSINNTTCAISGSPTGTQSSISYMVNATNASGSTSVSLSIAITTAIIYGGKGTGGVIISSDGGNSYLTYTTANGLGSNSVNWIYVSGSNVYVATAGGVSISTNGGTSYTNYTTANGLGNNNVTGVFASVSNVYAATDGGLSISTNGGTSYTNYTTANGLGSNLTYSVYASGSNVYVVTAVGVSISNNGGTSYSSYTTAN